MIAALFVDPKGVYANLPDVEDEARDARKYQGPWPVVAHPPCSRWCRLAGLVEKRWGHKKGDDGGCFESALRSVRTYGGVLEHPAYSDAWQRFRLPVPSTRGRWQRGFCGGWVCELDQAHFGHRARKSTWLYAYGTDLPGIPAKRAGKGIWLSWCDNHSSGKVVERMGKLESNATPIPFRDLLLFIARTSRIAKPSTCIEIQPSATTRCISLDITKQSRLKYASRGAP